MRSTHTVATLEVSSAAYDEIASRLRAASYDHSFLDDGVIDMHGIGLVKAPLPRAERSENLGRSPLPGPGRE